MSKLILVRHGQSIWNLENRFTGWADIPLSKKGILEARKAGKLLKNFKFDVTYTSELLRAQQTAIEILDINDNDNNFFKIHTMHKDKYSRYLKKHPEMNYMKLFIAEELNERNYGDLEGMNKDDARKKFGNDQVHLWRRSYDIAPPNGESLKMTSKRTLPYFKSKILKDLKQGKDVLVVAHGNSLRSIVMHIEKLNSQQVIQLEMATGVPYIYEFDKEMKLKTKKVLN